jgi:hypothetical protein
MILHFRDALFNRTTSMAADLDRKAQQIDGMKHLFNKEILLRSFFCFSPYVANLHCIQTTFTCC